MNRIIRNLIVAAPLATAALTMVPTGAMASDGPIIIAQPHTDPQPPIDDIAIPEPVEPKDKIALPKPKPPVDDKLGPKAKPTQPDGPDVITNREIVLTPDAHRRVRDLVRNTEALEPRPDRNQIGRVDVLDHDLAAGDGAEADEARDLDVVWADPPFPSV